jgi:hypothetical protein
MLEKEFNNWLPNKYDGKIINPWEKLLKTNGKCKYIAECDKDFLLDIDKKFKLDFIPQPYVGNPYSSVVYYLLGNPNPLGNNYSIELQELQKKNLSHEIIEYPLFWLDPKYKESEVYKWWIDNLSYLVGELGRKIITKYIFAIDYFGYFSENTPSFKNLPSQEYSFYLIKKAIEDKKIIIVARCANRWYNSISTLKEYENTFELNNPSNVIISPGNVGDENFDKIIERLRKCK